MSRSPQARLEQVRAKREKIESELKKSPDFQLYLLARAPQDRARMERLLVRVWKFRLWRSLTEAIDRAEMSVHRSPAVRSCAASTDRRGKARPETR